MKDGKFEDILKLKAEDVRASIDQAHLNEIERKNRRAIAIERYNHRNNLRILNQPIVADIIREHAQLTANALPVETADHRVVSKRIESREPTKPKGILRLLGVKPTEPHVKVPSTPEQLEYLWIIKSKKTGHTTWDETYSQGGGSSTSFETLALSSDGDLKVYVHYEKSHLQHEVFLGPKDPLLISGKGFQASDDVLAPLNLVPVEMVEGIDPEIVQNFDQTMLSLFK